MRVVLDTSAGVEVALNRPEAAAIAERLTKADVVLAPDLYIAEATNVFWKYFQFSALPLPACERGLVGCLRLVDSFEGCNELHLEALVLACNAGVSAYDAFFLVLARRTGAHVVSLDRALLDAARKQGIPVLA